MITEFDPTVRILALLPEFRQCSVYTDRLAFWEKHGLEEHLHYLAFQYEGERLPAELVNQLVKCRTWEEVTKMDILTLAPFDRDEAQQFAEWALKVRPCMVGAPKSVDILKAEFDKYHDDSEREGIKKTILKEALSAAQRWADIGEPEAEKWVTPHFRRNFLMEKGINIDKKYNDLAKGLNRKTVSDQYLVSSVPLCQISMDWMAVDTYLFAQSNYQFALFLENYDQSEQSKDVLRKPLSCTEQEEEAKERQATVKDFLAPLGSFHGINKERIMKEADFNRLLEYTQYMVENDTLPTDIQPIQQINISGIHIIATFHRMHKELFSTDNIHDTFIHFLIAVFRNFHHKEEDFKSFKTQFSKRPSDRYWYILGLPKPDQQQ